MGDYLELQAPQWMDFIQTCSPIRMEDFFEKSHAIHERIEDICESISENTENAQPMSQTDVTCTKTQADLDIIKSTPIKVVSPKHHQETETTYDEVLSDAMRKLELCKKPSKIREALNKTTHESNTFKTQQISNITRSSRSVGYRSLSNKRAQSGQVSATKSMKINKNMPNNDISVNAKEKSISQVLFKENKTHIENDDVSKKPNDLVDDFKHKKEKQNKEEDIKECNEKNEEHKEDIKKLNETDNKENNEEDDEEFQDESEESTDGNKEIKKENSQANVDTAIQKGNQIHSSNKHTVLTWYNHRRSLQKRRLSTNKKYVSLAEAVSRFQNDTPERFRTKSSKANNASMPLNMSKLMQNRLKPTIPISPALVSKSRTRPVTALSREEREKLEMEEMKKHQIKANPIPHNVLRGSRVVTRAKKSIASTHSSTQSNEKACVTGMVRPGSPLPHRDGVLSGPRNVVAGLRVADPSGIIVEHEEIAFFGVSRDSGVARSVTRIVPFSFEARDRDLQVKKEQRLKSLQEANKTKPEFHARPVPNFSRPVTPSAKQQQQNTKKSILPCPFSFDDRDKKAFERKEQLVKQVLEEDKRARVFRANPAPIFKPVMVRGRSKEHLLAKDQNVTSQQTENQENREPNVDSPKMARENISKSKNSVCTVDKHKAPLKACPLKLNTDKRAKERYEYNEKIKRKELEEEIKRQEAEKKKLESEKEIKSKLRKLTEVKARPMPTYKPVMIMKATKQLTNPQSPAFASKLKSKQT